MDKKFWKSFKIMIKKILFSLLLLNWLISPILAIDWVTLRTGLGKSVDIDIDSIKQVDHFYFYNIKLPDSNHVMTIQSGAKSTFSARINTVDLDIYNDLNGDYDNIANNATKDLEPVTYESVVYACYKKAKETIQRRNAYATINTDAR